MSVTEVRALVLNKAERARAASLRSMRMARCDGLKEEEERVLVASVVSGS